MAKDNNIDLVNADIAAGLFAGIARSVEPESLCGIALNQPQEPLSDTLIREMVEKVVKLGGQPRYLPVHPDNLPLEYDGHLERYIPRRWHRKLAFEHRAAESRASRAAVSTDEPL